MYACPHAYHHTASCQPQTYWCIRLGWGIRWFEFHSWCTHPECIACLVLDWEISPLQNHLPSSCNQYNSKSQPHDKTTTRKCKWATLKTWHIIFSSSRQQNKCWPGKFPGTRYFCSLPFLALWKERRRSEQQQHSFLLSNSWINVYTAPYTEAAAFMNIHTRNILLKQSSLKGNSTASKVNQILLLSTTYFVSWCFEPSQPQRITSV